jgi:uncharacterized protein YwbE
MEYFQKVEFYEGKLEVSKNWIRINGTYLPKNFIIGTYDLTGQERSRFNTEMYRVHFVLITGESKFSMEISHKKYPELRKNLYILKEHLPNAIITDSNWFSAWESYHKKKIVLNYKTMQKEMGVERLIFEWQDVFKKFSMDGVLASEVVSGNLVDIEVNGDTSGKHVTGKVDELLESRGNKDGCMVRLKDSGLVGRVKKVHGSMKHLEYRLEDKYKD